MKFKESKYLLGLALTCSLVGCSIFSSEPVQESPQGPMHGGTHAQLLGTDLSGGTDSSDHTDTSHGDNQNPDEVTPDTHNEQSVDEHEDNTPNPEHIEEPTPDSMINNNKGDAEGTFVAKDFAGNTVTQEIFTKSKLNVVNIWGTYCGYCIDEMPDLGELASEYDTSEVQFIGIVCDVWEGDDTSYAQSIIDQTGADYLHLLSNYSLYDWKLDSVEYIPQTFLIDEYGNTIDYIDGMLYKDEWIDVIEYHRQ